LLGKFKKKLNLAELSAEYVVDYIRNTLLPNFLNEETNQKRPEMGEEAYQKN
jgi:hypothetical protein